MMYLALFLCFIGTRFSDGKDRICKRIDSITLGADATIAEKWIATIHKSGTRETSICVGVFLSENAVLALPSCLEISDKPSNPSGMIVVSNSGEVWNPEKIVVHEGFESSKIENNIALIFLPSTAKWKMHDIICLPGSNAAIREFLAVGWKHSIVEKSQESCEYQDTYDYYGGDIPSTLPAQKVDTPEQCCDLCRNMSECQVFTWAKTSDEKYGKYCFLKTAIGTEPLEHTERISGSPYKRVPTTCLYQANTDYYGNDLGLLIRVDSASECCHRCQSTFNCIAWAYAIEQDGTYSPGSCWLKHTVRLRPSHNPKRISGIIKEIYLQAQTLQPKDLKKCKPTIICTTANNPPGLEKSWKSDQVLIGRINKSASWTLQGIGTESGIQNLTRFIPWIMEQLQKYQETILTENVLHVNTFIKDRHKNVVLLAGSITGSVAILCTILALIACLKCRRSSESNVLNRVQSHQVMLINKLGEGHFCHVWKGRLQSEGTAIHVAVKALKLTAGEREQKQFLAEAHILSKVHQHKNIVRAIGLCLDSRPNMLVMEHLNAGSLLQFLHEDETRLYLGYKDMVKICIDVCSACSFLEETGYIHRDISARNCLVNAGKRARVLCVKLSDFGLAKDAKSEYLTPTPDLAVAWTAPEGFLGKFSIKSDVWSFGVLMWEVFSWGSIPFGICSYPKRLHGCTMRVYNNEQIQHLVCVLQKNLLDLPDPCTCRFADAFKEIMEECWNNQCNERPTFSQIKDYLELEKDKELDIGLRMEMVSLGFTQKDEMQAIPEEGMEYPKFRCIDAYPQLKQCHGNQLKPIAAMCNVSEEVSV